jgi:hypothetical protein
MVPLRTVSLNLAGIVWKKTFAIASTSFLLGVCVASAAPLSLIAKSSNGRPMERESARALDGAIPVWKCDERSGPLIFKSEGGMVIPPIGVVYIEVAYLDQGYGRLDVLFDTKGVGVVRPDRFLGMTRTDSGNIVTARMRIRGIPVGASSDNSVRIKLQRPNDLPLLVQRVTIQDAPFEDSNFKFVISDPWQGPYQGTRVKPADNSTLAKKVMTGYQGWFRTPNDPEGKGWVHWGDIQEGTFLTDMWPDISSYPPSVLEKAADVKLNSGKQAYLFSSAWPAVVDTHFRWMREHDIDGVFLQRFVSDRLHSIGGGPEWVLANVRASANREGRIWAVEYDVSGYPEAKLLETLKTDWKWLVDEFKLLDDQNYAREGEKPVVFIWGLPFANRNISSDTANSVVDFFRNDPKYGGNHVIGGIPANWRTMNAAWQEHFKKYESILTWMPGSHAGDFADFRKLGITYYPHVKPGFSWANMKHLPTGDDAVGYVPREGGDSYWRQLTDAAQAGADRLFVGMFDEYDEGTAIMPMSDDPPPTPVRPGVGATFYDGPVPQENGDIVLLPMAELALGETAPSKETNVDHFFAKLGGVIIFPAAGTYTFSVEGAAGDDFELFLNGKRALQAHPLKETTITAEKPVTVGKGDSMAFRLQCRHRTGTGTLRLLWEAPGMPRRPVDASALRDAWGRFLSNEGESPDRWLTVTSM